MHAYFHEADQKTSKKLIISNIVNTLTDRCTANHAAIGLVNQAWNKSLNELTCHLHPLDSVATKAHTAKCEVIPNLTKAVFGKDCIDANIVLAMKKMRYKDGKGDTRDFVTFLENENLPRGILPRYRGHRSCFFISAESSSSITPRSRSERVVMLVKLDPLFIPRCGATLRIC